MAIGAFWLGRQLDLRAEAEGFGIIETDRIALDLEGAADGWEAWLDPAWSELLLDRLAAIENFPADDPAGVAEVVAAIGEFSFIEQLGTPRVIWPDGLELTLRLRRPVACIAFEGRFHPVAVDWQHAEGPRGVILPGGGLTPPAFRGAFLPAIGGISGPLTSVWLEDPALLGALSVADSMWTELDPQAAHALGRIVIDASQDANASIEQPGTRLELEGGRRAYFGRSPYQGAPGELPSAAKWTHLATALDYLTNGQNWDLIDLRWDTPQIHFVAPR